MSDMPREISIQEEGPREGFQFEKGPIPTARKIELIDALSETGLREIQVGSYVNPKRVPGWADVEDVVAGFERKAGIHYTVLWLNERGLLRALEAEGVYLKGSITTAASETFMKMNQNRGFEDNIAVQHNQVALYKSHGIDYFRGSMMAAFGCNFEGDVPVSRVVEQAEVLHRIAEENDVALDILSLADTMAWATPQSIKRVVGAVRDRWPDLRITLHLHDTRGLGCANAYAGLEMGVDSFDSSVAGLGGCPFAGHKGAAGNICTEDLAFMCAEMGIDTGIDLDKLLDAARLAEDIVGHDLPGKVKWGGSLGAIREKLH